jgi:hypothetical protein
MVIISYHNNRSLIELFTYFATTTSNGSCLLLLQRIYGVSDLLYLLLFIYHIKVALRGALGHDLALDGVVLVDSLHGQTLLGWDGLLVNA